MTSKEINDPISGFYYDLQCNDKLTMAALYPNMEPDASQPNGFKNISDAEDDAGPGVAYSKTPICTAIINEDFQISVANSFNDVGNDPIGGLWDQVKPLAPYLGELSSGLSDIANATQQWLGDNGTSSKFAGGVKWLNENVFKPGAEKAGMASTYLARSLVVQGTRFVYYSGTGVDYGNLMMKFTLFSGYDKDGTWRSVNDWIKGNGTSISRGILPYVIGEFKGVDEIPGEAGKFIHEYAAWQLPPGGFTADIKNVDNVQSGTLKLRIGVRYAIENLVISGAQFNFSKTMVKNPNSASITSEDYLVPLSCDVILNLKPATKSSRKSLERFVFGDASKIYREDYLKDMEKDYKKIDKLNQKPAGINKM